MLNYSDPVVLVGLGELGSLFARCFLRLGIPVYPIIRGMDMTETLKAFVNEQLILIAVAEKDIEKTLAAVPENKKKNIALLQNELLPHVWERQDIISPTVISVWFEKKKGQDCKVLLPSPIYGPKAEMMVDALAKLDIPSYMLSNQW